MCKYFCVKCNLLFLFFMLFFCQEGFGLNAPMPITKNVTINSTVKVSLDINYNDFAIVFYQFGDGEYYIWQQHRNSSQLVPDIVHKYKQAGTYTVEVWAIRYNDNDDPPDMVAIPTNLTADPSGSYRSLPSHKTTGYQSSWNIVAGDYVFYIISANNTCIEGDLATFNISFQHDSKLQFSPQENYYYYEGSGNGIYNKSGNTQKYNHSIRTIQWNNISIGYNKTKLFYLKFKAQDGLPPNIDINNSLNITDNIEGPTCGDTIINNQETVQLSHDPNYKAVLSEQSISWSKTNTLKVKYQIEFQNLGHGSADTVIIKDIIDLGFVEGVTPYATITSAQWVKDNISVLNSTIPARYGSRLSPNEYQWILPYETPRLRGTNEPEYMDTHFDPDTKDTLIFEVEYDFDGGILHSCGMILNRAEVIFDCNEIMYTNVSKIPISCKESIKEQICSDCEEIKTFIKLPFGVGENPDSITFIDAAPFLNALDTNFVSTDYSYHWYPQIGTIDRDSVLNNLIDKIDTYYLVVSSKDSTSTCKRFFITFKIEKQCPDIPIIISTKHDSVTAFVDPNYPEQSILNDYYWNYSCSPATTTIGKMLNPGKHFVQLTNYRTGCSIRKYFIIEDCSLPISGHTPLVFMSLVIVALGIILVKKGIN